MKDEKRIRGRNKEDKTGKALQQVLERVLLLFMHASSSPPCYN